MRFTRAVVNGHKKLLALLTLLLMFASVGEGADYYQSLELEGLKITLDVWSTVGSPGYVPINLDIANLAGGDRTIEITAQGNGYLNYSGYYGQRTTNIDLVQAIALKRGDRQRLTIPFPVKADNESVQLQIRERGRILHRANFNFGVIRVDFMTPALMVANPSTAFGRATRDLQRTEIGGQLERMGGPFRGRPGFTPSSGIASSDITREPERLPTNWLGYTTLRAVFIGKQEWGQLSQPQKDALLAWTASGGDLSFVDGDWQTLLPDSQRRPTAIGVGDGAERYFLGSIFFPKLADLNEKGLDKILADMRNNGPNGRSSAFPGDRTINAENAYGLRAKVDAFKTTAGDNYSSWRLPLAAASTDINAIPWDYPPPNAVERTGFKLQIPGVGGVSTRVYLAILVLFTVLIGPVNFWVLKRRRQQVLMVLTTPLISIIFIALLSGYAIAGEGFGIRARAETFTFLDQSSKQAATHASASFYAAGMAPWSGLSFSRDAAIFSSLSSSQQALNLNLTEAQRYTSGLLQARAPANLEFVGFRTARERLTFSRDGANRAVVNGLEATITQLLYRDGGSIYALTEAVAPGARGKLEPGAPRDLDGFLRPQGVPQSPLTFQGERADKLRHFFLDSLEDGAFYAVLDRSPFWEPGVASIEERGSYHAVAGYAGGEIER
jgi:hypothetical protein